MDGSGLKKKKFWDQRSKLPIILLIAAIAVVALVIIGMRYSEDLMVVLPGYYQNHQYNSLTAEKNDKIEENSRLLSENDENEQEILGLGTSIEDYTRIVELNDAIIQNLNEVSENLDSITAYDKEFLEMRLPSVVGTYVNLSYELDKVREEMVDVSLDITEARKDLASFNLSRAHFDACLEAINWTGPDQDISASILGCLDHVEQMQNGINAMEESYDVELELLSSYVTVLNEQWEASAAYYGSLAEGDYAKANEHDAVFVEKKRIISEMDSVTVFNEVYDEYLLGKVEEFADLSKEEAEKNEEATEWYELNISR